MPIDDLKTVAEAAKQLRLSQRAVYQMCRRGALGHFRVAGGRSVRIPQSAIDAYLKAHWIDDRLPSSDVGILRRHGN